ncbi:MAG: non-ribosomal peptide synthetase, partial [Pseudomonadales bacterium]|nr:non-ribosomal peptide synthetase [Pseudomonadales bacterium]
YSELNARANRLAHYLVSKGVKPQDFVGICMARKCDVLVSMLASMKSRCVFIPIDSAYPEQRIRYIIEDSQMATVVADSETVSLVEEHVGIVCNIDDFYQLTSENETDREAEEVAYAEVQQSEEPVYAIYTSGSTGNPKCVRIPNRALTNYLSSASNRYYDSQLAGALVASSFSFDGTLPNIYLPLLHGGKVRFISEENTIEGLAEVLARADQPWMTKVTPSQMQTTLDSMETTTTANHTLVMGGETLGINLAKNIFTKCPNASLFNHYGPTETTIGCLTHNVQSESLSAEHKITLGRPLDNVACLVLNEFRQPVPVGVAGELYVGGEGVSLGYFNREELTREKFVVLNSKIANANTWYQTGDLVRQQENGEIEFLGRKDNQFKLRGIRIESAEIEQAAIELEEVSSCAIKLQKNSDGAEFLVAYLVLENLDSGGEGAPDNKIEEIKTIVRRKLEKRLPAYMVPRHYALLSELPQNRHGKVDYRALPEYEQNTLDEEIILPETDTEKKLADFFRLLLNTEQNISVERSFFDMGGHSLLAMKLSTQIHKEFSLKLPLKTLFSMSTIRELSDYIDMMLLLEEKKSMETDEDMESFEI